MKDKKEGYWQNQATIFTIIGGIIVIALMLKPKHEHFSQPVLTNQPVSSDTYGAIAYSPSSQQLGWAWGFDSKEKAENQAIQKCSNNDCQSVSWFNNGFGSLAVTGQGGWGGTWGNTQQEAEQKAIQICKEYNPQSSCNIILIIHSKDGVILDKTSRNEESNKFSKKSYLWRSESGLTRITNLDQICWGVSNLYSVQTVFGYDNNHAYIKWNITNLGNNCPVNLADWEINTYPVSN